MVKNAHYCPLMNGICTSGAKPQREPCNFWSEVRHRCKLEEATEAVIYLARTMREQQVEVATHAQLSLQDFPCSSVR